MMAHLGRKVSLQLCDTPAPVGLALLRNEFDVEEGSLFGSVVVPARGSLNDSRRNVGHHVLQPYPNESVVSTRASRGKIKGDTLSRAKVLVTAKAHPASKALLIMAEEVVGGAEANPNGFSNLMPQTSTERSTSSIAV